jgi:hypothetical protein
MYAHAPRPRQPLCRRGVGQGWYSTCYYAAALNGLLLSPRIMRVLQQELAVSLRDNHMDYSTEFCISPHYLKGLAESDDDIPVINATFRKAHNTLMRTVHKVLCDNTVSTVNDLAQSTMPRNPTPLDGGYVTYALKSLLKLVYGSSYTTCVRFTSNEDLPRDLNGVHVVVVTCDSSVKLSHMTHGKRTRLKSSVQSVVTRAYATAKTLHHPTAQYIASFLATQEHTKWGCDDVLRSSSLMNTEMSLRKSGFVLDHAAIVYTHRLGGLHAVIGTFCGEKPVVVDSNHPEHTIPLDWRFADLTMLPKVLQPAPPNEYLNGWFNYAVFVKAALPALDAKALAFACPAFVAGAIPLRGKRSKKHV